jgi:poly-gamma-glutamate synthesis protein (capsule biosynthesis protein)
MRLSVPLFALALLLAACSSDTASPEPAVVETIASPPPVATSTPDGIVTIGAVGDVMLDRDVETLMATHGALYPFELVAGLLQNADVTIANLESALTNRGVEQIKAYTFRVDPRFAGGLTQAGIDVVSLGNNHTADYGPEGVEDTIAALDAAGVANSGAGMDEASARRPAFVDAEALRIAFLSYTDIFENTFAGPGSAGVALATVDAIGADVRAARAQADVVVVSLHFGIEYTDAPQASQQQLARAAIDAGALLVLGSHPHTLQGWEHYGDGLIAYSLGNFIFDLDEEDLTNLGRRAFDTAVLYVTLSSGGVIDVRAEPVTIDPNENRPRPATVEEAAAILTRIDELNALAGGP